MIRDKCFYFLLKILNFFLELQAAKKEILIPQSNERVAEDERFYLEQVIRPLHAP